MGENKESAQGVRRHSLEEMQAGDVGDWWDDGENLWINIPHDWDGTIYPDLVRWPYTHPLENGACWQYNNDPDSPTLTPSLHYPTVWHGWMKNGRLESVP